MEPPALDGVVHRDHDLATGVRVHVAHGGREDGPAVVALHGFPHHWWVWRRVIPLLPDVRFLAMDLRGLGWSGAPADGDFRKARLAEDAAALLDVLGIERALLLGHDWGAWAGFLAATGTPQRWSRARRDRHRASVGHAGGDAARAPAVRLPAAARRSGARAPDHPARRAAAGAPAVRRALPRAATGGGREPPVPRLPPVRGRPRARVPRLQVPARLLQGTRDPLGTALALGLERHGDDARTELLDGCGHMVPEQRPAEVVAAVRSLL